MFSNNQRRPAADHAADTSLIASGTAVTGDIHFAGALHLDGRVEGGVLAEPDSDAVFTLSADGEVVGEIRVPNAVINGTVQGNIVVSERLELAAQARIEGDVCYQVLEMAAGAEVNGRMLHKSAEPRQLAGPEPEAEVDEVEVDADESGVDEETESAFAAGD